MRARAASMHWTTAARPLALTHILVGQPVSEFPAQALIRAAMTGESTTATPHSAPAAASVRTCRDLSIAVPVFRTGNAAAALIERLRSALPGEDWEVVFVDDNSTDDTVATIAALA